MHRILFPSSISSYVLCCILLSACATTSKNQGEQTENNLINQTTKFHGQLLGHDGKPLEMGHLRVDTTWHEIAEDGKFSLDLPRNRLINVLFTGLHHNSENVSILTTQDDTIGLNIKLGTHKLAESIEQLEVVTLEPKGKGDGYKKAKRLAMTKSKNGQWTAEVELKDGKFLYSIAGTRTDSDKTVHPNMAQEYSRHESVGYFGILSAPNSNATIVFDPKALPPSDKKASIVFDKAESTTAQIANLKRETSDYSRKFWAARRNKKESTTKKLKEENPRSVRAWQETIQKRLKSVEPMDPQVRQALLLAYFELPGYYLEDGTSEPPLETSRWMGELIENLEPTSPFWRISRSSMHTIGTAISAAFFDTIAAQTQDPEIAALMYMHNISTATMMKLKTKQRVYFDKLTTELAQTSTGKRFEKQKEKYLPDHPFKKGKPVPTFSLASLEKADEKITPKNYLGSHLLIEVWGTWCKPCVADMGKLHDINKRFSPKGLKMLSIAVFDTQKKVQKHRKEWPMPWDHVVLDKESSDQLMGKFQAMGVPSYILVDPKGLVLEKGFGWRDQMKNILAEYLEKTDTDKKPTAAKAQ